MEAEQMFQSLFFHSFVSYEPKNVFAVLHGNVRMRIGYSINA